MAKKKIDNYLPMVDFLKEMLGPNYEIVLHSLEDDDGQIIKIANGYITGRKVGDPLTTFALEGIASKRYEKEDYLLNYNAMSQSGQLLRSSTLFIKDEEELIGLLCINFDDYKFKELSDTLQKLVHPDEVVFKREKPTNESEPLENISESIADLTRQIIVDYFVKNNIFLDNLNSTQQKLLIEGMPQESKVELVARLYDKGIFLLKGAVSEVASQFYVSEPTMYRYLSKIKENS